MAGAGTGTPLVAPVVATGAEVTVTLATSLLHTWTNLSIGATYTRLLFTAKRWPGQPDARALVQVQVSNPADAATDGLLVIAGVAATAAQRTQAALVVDQPAGSVVLTLTDDLTALLERARVPCDVKQILADGTSEVLISGHLSADYTPTGAV